MNQADIVKDKQAIYERAKALSANGTLAAAYLDGEIDLLKNKMLSTASGIYTDDNGNLVIEAADGLSAMMLTGAGFMLGTRQNINNEYNWRSFGTGEGFTADMLTTGILRAGVITILGSDQFYWDANNIYIFEPGSNGQHQIRIGQFDGTNYGIGFTTDGGTTWQNAIGFNGTVLSASDETRLSNAETAISLVPGEIELAVNSIQIGGTNLFPQSAAATSPRYVASGEITTGYTPQSGWFIELPEWVTTPALTIFQSSNIYDKDKIIVGDEYTLSFSYRADGATTFMCDLYGENSDDIAGAFGAITVDDANTTIKRKVVTGKLVLAQGVSSISFLRLRFWRDTDAANENVRIWDIKLERGNKDTGWDPSPVDFEAKIKVNRDGIALLTTEVNSLDGRMDAAELKITPTAIVSTVTSSDAYQEFYDQTGVNELSPSETLYSKIQQTAQQIDISVGAIQIGGTNLFPQSAATSNSHYTASGNVTETITPQSVWYIDLPEWTGSAALTIFQSGNFYDKDKIIINDDYTLSFSYVAEGSTTLMCDLYGENSDDIAGVFGAIIVDDANTTPKRKTVTGKLILAQGVSSISFLRLRFWRESGVANKDIKIWDVKLEKGNKATDWSPSPEDPVAAVESGSTVIINKDEIYLGTPQFRINVSGDAGDTTFDKSGLTVPVINSPSVGMRYAGVAAITVNANTESDGETTFRNLSDALGYLSGKTIDFDVTVTLATDTTEGSAAILRGVQGNGSITIDLNSHTVNGRIYLEQVQLDVDVENGTISAVGGDPRLGIYICPSVYIDSVSFMGSSSASGDGVYCEWSRVNAIDCGVYKLKNGFSATDCSRMYVRDTIGNNSSKVGTVYRAAHSSDIGMSGDVPPYEISVSAVDSSSHLYGELPDTEDSGGTTPVAPTTTTTVTLTTNGTKTYQSNGSGWLNDLTLRQGTWGGSFRDIGVISFDFSSLSGATVQSATLTLRRLDGGKGSAITVKATTTNVKPGSGTPTVDTSAAYAGTIGTVNINNTLTCSLPAALVQALISDSTNKKAIALYDDGAISNGNTQNYGVFAGSDNAAYKPTLTITYTS